MKVFLDQLKEKQTVQSIFFAEEKILTTDKNGKAYISLLLRDRTGRMDARVWDNVEEATRKFDSGDVVKVKGHMQVFNGRRQFVIHKIQRAETEEFQAEDLNPSADPRLSEWSKKLDAYVASISSAPLKKLMESVTKDPEIRKRLESFPAARSIHHAYTGGMLEHVVSICDVMDGLAKVYTYLQRDLLIFGAIFHDIGKLWELDISEGVQYTRTGRLVGHMEIGCALVDEHSKKIPDFSAELKDILKHIILSHHGKYEYGSPKRPKFLEAYLVSQVDELDSRLNSIRRFMEEESAEGGSWTRYSEMYDRYFYLGIMQNKDLEFD